MFSLIITIISIALVAALALATIYYGGNAFTQGQAEANASRILNQGQQILGAAEMFRLDNGTWPTVERLVLDKYLKSAPMGMSAMTTVNAQVVEEGWNTPLEGEPVYVLNAIDEATCQEINQASYGLNGILEQARTTLAAQCYGANEVFRVVIAKNPASIQTVADSAAQSTFTSGDVTADAIPLATDTAAWAVAPSEDVAGGGSVEPPVSPIGVFNYTVTLSIDGNVSGLPRKDTKMFTALSSSSNIFVASQDRRGPYRVDNDSYPADPVWIEYYNNGIRGGYNDGEYGNELGTARPSFTVFDAPVTFMYYAANMSGYGGTEVGGYSINFPQAPAGQSTYEFCVTFAGIDPNNLEYQLDPNPPVPTTTSAVLGACP